MMKQLLLKQTGRHQSQSGFSVLRSLLCLLYHFLALTFFSAKCWLSHAHSPTQNGDFLLLPDWSLPLLGLSSPLSFLSLCLCLFICFSMCVSLTLSLPDSLSFSVSLSLCLSCLSVSVSLTHTHWCSLSDPVSQSLPLLPFYFNLLLYFSNIIIALTKRSEWVNLGKRNCPKLLMAGSIADWQMDWQTDWPTSISSVVLLWVLLLIGD